MDTAGGSNSANYYAKMGAGILIINPQGGDIRCLEGATPTASLGLPLTDGGYYQIPMDDISSFELISTSGTVTCNVHMAKANGEAEFNAGGGAGGGSSTSSSSASGGGNNTYYAKPSGTNADSVSAYAGATTLTVTGLPFTFTKYDIASIKQIPTSGDSTIFSDPSAFSVSGTTITVAGATFASSDEFIVTFEADDKAYSKSSDTQRIEEVDPLNLQYLNDHIVDGSNETAATYRVEVDMKGSKSGSLQWNNSGGVLSCKLLN